MRNELLAAVIVLSCLAPLNCWKEFPGNDVFVPFDFSRESLQLETTSTFGSGHFIYIKFKEGTSTYDLGFALSMTEEPSYRVMSCGGWTTFTKPKSNLARIWTVTYTGSSLVLYCEGEQIFDVKFETEGEVTHCELRYATPPDQIALSSGTVSYRIKPSQCNELRPWPGVKTSAQFPVQEGEVVSLTCEVGLRHVGDSQVTCNQLYYESYKYTLRPACEEGDSLPDLLPGFEAFEDNTFVFFDMSKDELQLKSNSMFGSGDMIWIKFKQAGSEQNDLGFSVTLIDPPRYRVSYCTSWVEFEKPFITIPRRWTVKYTGASLVLFCEGTQVFDVKFTSSGEASSCALFWETAPNQIMKAGSEETMPDTASDYYRIKPTTCVGIRPWPGVKTSAQFPVQEGEVVTLTCEVGLRHVGDSQVTCNQLYYESYKYTLRPACEEGDSLPDLLPGKLHTFVGEKFTQSFRCEF
ncbi:hypothetical protein ACHWQZ_G009852 [Mnemiopsis leidyi]